MKKKIHPEYHTDAKIICACGNVIETGSVLREMKVDICSACHPFYTGKKKTLDTAGRVERFKKMVEKTSQKKEAEKKAQAEAKKVQAEKAKAKKEKTTTKKTPAKKTIKKASAKKTTKAKK